MIGESSSSGWGATSLWALIAANAIPLVCALVLGWELEPLLALYWAESAVIGAVTILRIVTNRTAPWKAKLLSVPGFAVHFGVFMFVHAAFLGVALRDGGEVHAGNRGDVGPAVLLPYFEAPGMKWTLVALMGSHLWSYAVHDIAGGERDTVPLAKQMFRPYGRIIVMHLTLLVGLGVMKFLGDSRWLAAVFAVFKTIADAIAHRRAHRARSLEEATVALAGDRPGGIH